MTQKALAELARSSERIMPGLTAKRIRIACTTTGRRTARILIDLREGRA